MLEKLTLNKTNGETITVDPVVSFEIPEYGKYAVYSLNEIDANNLETLYIAKLVENNGSLVGNTISDETEWTAVKNALKNIISGGNN